MTDCTKAALFFPNGPRVGPYLAWSTRLISHHGCTLFCDVLTYFSIRPSSVTRFPGHSFHYILVRHCASPVIYRGSVYAMIHPTSDYVTIVLIYGVYKCETNVVWEKVKQTALNTDLRQIVR